MRPRLLFCALLLIASTAFAQQGDPVTDFAVDDATMNAAQEDARESLPLFFGAVLDAQGYGAAGTGLKVAFPVEGGGVEVIWVSPFLRQSETEFVGALANAPNALGDLAAGDVVQFDASMIRDWTYVSPDGLLWGNYTTRVMIPYLPETQAEGLIAALSADPVPADW